MEVYKDNGLKNEREYTTTNSGSNNVYVKKEEDNFFTEDFENNSDNSSTRNQRYNYQQQNNNYNQPQNYGQPQQSEQPQNYFQRQMSEEEIRAKKAHLLWKFNKLNEDSKYSSMLLDMESDLEIVENEVYRVEKQQQNESGMEVVRNGYLTLVSGLELVSKKQKIVALNLDGWSRKVSIDSKNSNYEKVFEEIYEEYFSNIKTNPIIMLTILTIWSGMSVHLSNMALGSSFSMPQQQRTNYPESIASNTNYNTNNNNDDDNDDDDLDSIIQKMKQTKLSKEFDLESNVSIESKNSSIKFDMKSDVSEIIPEEPKKKRKGRPRKNTII